METGDPKQAAVLAVLAVGAVGFLLTRLGGKALPLAKVAANAPHAAPPHPVVTLALLRDPFSHPRLATKPERVALAAPPSTLIPDKAVPFSPIGSLPAADPLAPVPPAKPEKVKTAKPKASAPTTTTVGLEAIVGASDTVAFLTVDGTESRPFRPSERVAGAIRLLSVGDGDVVLAGPRGKLTLGVGERKSL